ncbi:MAG: PCRF domain-containing protein, partial [Nitrososphaerota archaeon]
MDTINMTSLDRKLSALEKRYEELQRIMADPETASDPTLLQRYGREYSSITDVVEKYRALQEVRTQLSDTEAMLGDGLDEEMRALAYDEMEQLRARE